MLPVNVQHNVLLNILVNTMISHLCCFSFSPVQNGTGCNQKRGEESKTDERNDTLLLIEV